MFDSLFEQHVKDSIKEEYGIARDSLTIAGMLASLYADPEDPLLQHVAVLPTLDSLCAALVVATDQQNDDAAAAIFAEIRRLSFPCSCAGADAAVFGAKSGLWRLH